nr:MAG TPA: hypothetical protein [Bacteriophage sp.]
MIHCRGRDSLSVLIAWQLHVTLVGGVWLPFLYKRSAAACQVRRQSCYKSYIYL